MVISAMIRRYGSASTTSSWIQQQMVVQGQMQGVGQNCATHRAALPSNGCEENPLVFQALAVHGG